MAKGVGVFSGATAQDFLVGEFVETDEVALVASVAGYQTLHLFGITCAVGDPNFGPQPSSINFFKLSALNLRQILRINITLDILTINPPLKLLMNQLQRRNQHIGKITFFRIAGIIRSQLLRQYFPP